MGEAERGERSLFIEEAKRGVLRKNRLGLVIYLWVVVGGGNPL